MSILIKGMDMPKYAYHHTITIYSDGTVATGKPNNYKAIEIKTPPDTLSYLTDRPCAVCKCHTESGCSEWECVFERRNEHG